MKLWESSIPEFVNLIDSKEPAPGGGSVSALMSVLGVSLIRMVGHLSVNKKRFKKLDQDVQDKFNETLQRLSTLKIRLIPLIDEDTNSFNKIIAAYKLAEDSLEEVLIKENAIKEATIEAIEVPLKVAKLSLEIIDCLEVIIASCNKQTMSDLGVGTLALASGVEGALFNVLINLDDFLDEDLVNYYKLTAKDILDKTYEKKALILARVNTYLNK